MISLRSRTVSLMAMAAATLVGACSYAGGDMSNPLRRKAEWFSYVAADDIRASCTVGSPDRFRVIYNGNYNDQLRMYDMDMVRKVLAIHVATPGNAAHVSLTDPLAPWTGTETRVTLTPETWDHLTAAFGQSGMFAPPPVGLDLPSRSYFWTAAFCKDGHYGFTAWAYPSPAFDALTFDKIVLPLDPTGIPVAAPGPVPYDPVYESELRLGKVSDFILTVGKDGPVR